MTNEKAVAQLEAELLPDFRELASLQNRIRTRLTAYAHGKTLKGNELVGWLGEIYGALLYDGMLVDEREEHDFVSPLRWRVSVKTRRGWNSGWRQSSAISKVEGDDCPTHLLFVHLDDDYSLNCMWLLEWRHLLAQQRFKKHIVRGSQRSFIFEIDPEADVEHAVFQMNRPNGMEVSPLITRASSPNYALDRAPQRRKRVRAHSYRAVRGQ